jgi:hypothetical protein
MLRIAQRYADQNGTFEPEEIGILVAAFEEAWAQLLKSGARLDSEYRIVQARDSIGKYVIEEANKGERNPRRLREAALLNYSRMLLRRPSSVHSRAGEQNDRENKALQWPMGKK